MQTIFPILRYHDARGAIRWLGAAFGFVEVFSVPESGEYVRHAQLMLGTNIIMMGSVRSDDGIETPKVLGASTQALSVYVEDPDAHFRRAQATGAEIVTAPADTDFGAREYHVRDLEGHFWAFGTFRPESLRETD
jgi:uncharacterized glyoxalase superfamily protein PhnB